MRSSRWDDETTDGPEISAEDHATAEAARRRRDVGEAVRGVRLARRMPVRRLAAITGIPERTIDDLEAGRPVDVGTAILIAEAVGLDVVAAMTRLARNVSETAPQDDENALLPSPLD
nr:helix-turn-helix transcriptional regulator [Methylobacterium sp. L1A1]